MELTCDPGFKNQPSCCLFRTFTFAGKPNKLRRTMVFSKQLGGLLSIETSVYAGLRSWLGRFEPARDYNVG